MPDTAVVPTSQDQHRRAQPPEEKSQRQRRIDAIFAILGVLLLAVVVVGIIGVARTAHPVDQLVSSYTADGGAYTTLPHMAILWLWIAMMGVAGTLGLGIAFAYQHQQ
jgi:hypothetical protein